MKAAEYSVCVDCCMFLATGNHDEMKSAFESEEWKIRQEEIETAVKREETENKGHFAEYAEKTDDFSGRVCELCRSHLAGERYNAVMIINE